MSVQSDALAAAIVAYHTGAINQAALSAAIEAAGVGLPASTVTAVQNLRDTMTMRMLFGPEADLAVASTTLLTSASSGLIRITGASSTINSFGPVPDTSKGGSPIRFVRFQNAQTVAAGVLATGAVNFTAGQTAILQGLTGSNWLLR